MLELLSQISAVSVFLGIAAIGFLFLLISLIFGEIFDHFDFGHGFDHDLGHGGPGFFSTRVLSVFITAFGGFGAISVYQGFGILPSSFFGFAGGVVLASVIYFFARFLFGQQASSATNAADLVGRTAEVTVSIPSGGVGQVRCLVGESMMDKIARTRDGSAIPYHSLVKIEEIIGDSAIVSPLGSPQPVADPNHR
jgi:membrane protein implicated in regulation of membrane protease activity